MIIGMDLDKSMGFRNLCFFALDLSQYHTIITKQLQPNSPNAQHDLYSWSENAVKRLVLYRTGRLLRKKKTIRWFGEKLFIADKTHTPHSNGFSIISHSNSLPLSLFISRSRLCKNR